MLSYINMFLIIVLLVLVLFCFATYLQANSLFAKISAKYAGSTDASINDPFKKIWTGTS